MTCHDARDLFPDALDDALAPEARAALDAHLAGCPDCRRELGRLEATVALLHAVEPARAPVGFVDRVLARAAPEPWHVRWRRRLAAPRALRRPIEVTVLALVALTAVYLYERTPELQQELRAPAPPPPAPAAPAPPAPAAPAARPAPVAPTPLAKSEADRPGSPAPKNVARAPAEAPVPRADVAAPAAAPEAATPAAAPPAPPPAASPEPAVARARQADQGEGKMQAETRTKQAETSRAPSAGLAGRLAPTPDVAGALVVADREVAVRALADAVARLGGAEVGRRADADALVVELSIPAGRYPALVEALGRIGRWRPDREPADPAAALRLTLRLVPA